jgi:hypothetical protein
MAGVSLPQGNFRLEHKVQTKSSQKSVVDIGHIEYSVCNYSMTTNPTKPVRAQARARQGNALRKERLGLVTRMLHIRVKDKHTAFLQ